MLRLFVAAAIALSTASCWGYESYRYKLTLAVNTPEGIKRASSVVEVMYADVWLPERGTMHKLRGEALYVDLGAGRRPLIALLTCDLHPLDKSQRRWTRDAGPGDNLLSELYGPALPNLLDDAKRLSRVHGARRITPSDLPDLVTFADINDPKSVIEVDPTDLTTVLGPDISWNELTLAMTDEPITTGIESKLPWIPAYEVGMLDGDPIRFYSKTSLANKLSVANFYDSVEIKRK
ncbi:conserved hypothetical protein; putative signal peptide [Bradyrhizobium sp. ORS 278]|nr:conserved hypothetical protein; putative signal peptide [Bradyrhizobium sp. ORS 278]